jgi:hypothetical protein
MQVMAAGVAGGASCQALPAPTAPRQPTPSRLPRALRQLSSGAGEAAAPLLLLVPGQAPSTMGGAAAAATLRHSLGPSLGAMDGAALSPRHRRRHRASPLAAVSDICSYSCCLFLWTMQRCSVMFQAKIARVRSECSSNCRCESHLSLQLCITRAHPLNWLASRQSPKRAVTAAKVHALSQLFSPPDYSTLLRIPCCRLWRLGSLGQEADVPQNAGSGQR